MNDGELLADGETELAQRILAGTLGALQWVPADCGPISGLRSIVALEASRSFTFQCYNPSFPIVNE